MSVSTLFGSIGPSSAYLSAAVGSGTLTTGRLLGTTAALVALAGVVVGGQALARAGGRTAKKRAIAAFAAGLTGMAAGGYVVAVAEGGPGTGYGIVGGFAAVGIGLIATVLGGSAFARLRRISGSDAQGAG